MLQNLHSATRDKDCLPGPWTGHRKGAGTEIGKASRSQDFVTCYRICILQQPRILSRDAQESLVLKADTFFNCAVRHKSFLAYSLAERVEDVHSLKNQIRL